MKSDQTTGKALRRLTADQVVAYFTRSNFIGCDVSQYTVVSTAGDRIPADWFIEDHS